MSSIDLDRIEDCLEYIRVLENNLSHARDKAHNAYTSGRAAGAAEERAALIERLESWHPDSAALSNDHGCRAILVDAVIVAIRRRAADAALAHVPPADPAKEDSDE
jgi:hypothetical protein